MKDITVAPNNYGNWNVIVILDVVWKHYKQLLSIHVIKVKK